MQSFQRICFIVTLVCVPLAAQSAVVILAADLTEEQALTNPDNFGSASGAGAFTLDTATGDFIWQINWSGLTGTPTAAHFHGPAPAGSPAGVAFGLIGPDPGVGGSINDFTANGSLSGIGTVTLGDVADILAGLWYINIHSTSYGGGEIRGQLYLAAAGTLNPVPLPAAVWMLGSALSGLFGLRRFA